MSAFLCHFVVFYLIFSFQSTYSIQTTSRSEKKHQRRYSFCLKRMFSEFLWRTKSTWWSFNQRKHCVLICSMLKECLSWDKSVCSQCREIHTNLQSVSRNAPISNQCREMHQSTISVEKCTNLQSVSIYTPIYNQCREIH